jgi:hypothetical protein
MRRRGVIGEAGVRLVARGGVRALTHRAVDEEAGLPLGSTSYYARTRRELTALVIDWLAAGTQGELDEIAIPATMTVDQAVQLAEEILDRLARNGVEPAARFALLLEARGDEELHSVLTEGAAVRGTLVEKTTTALSALGVAEPELHAADTVGLLDALLMHRVARAAPMDTSRVLRAYLDGLSRRGATHRPN